MLVLPIIPFPAINPVLISIGPFAVRWYALAYIVGIVAGWLYARAIIASERLWGGRAPFTVTSARRGLMPPYDARRTLVVADRASVEDDYLVAQLA